MRRSLRRLVQEPLVHFLILGLAVFAFHHAFAKAPPRTIEVTRDVTASLRADHVRRTGAEPTPEEERALVERWIDDEVRVREAQALGLDQGDVIVRRRLAQKLDFVLEGDVESAEPTDAELLAFRDRHPADFPRAPRLSLQHVFVGRALHPADADAVAARILVQLSAGADPASLGDPFLRGASFSAKTEAELAAILGQAPAHAAVDLAPGTWSAPIASRDGLHLVRVSERHDDAALDPALRAELRAAVLGERRAEAEKRALAERRRNYDVRIESGALGGTP
jgi:hypothetical protein